LFWHHFQMALDDGIPERDRMSSRTSENTPSYGSPGNKDVDLDPGVHYVCERCNACCKWPGDVRIDEDEVIAIADFLGMSEAGFIKQFTRLRSDRQGLSLMEKENHECVMLEDGGCRIHPVKPSQCAGFPNKWNFEGWREICRAVPVPIGSQQQENR
jgi:Fe-S-cluster containining protein